MFLSIRIAKELFHIFVSWFHYFDQHYMWNDYQITELIQLSIALAFMSTRNWYLGLWTVLQSWLMIPGYIIRLDGGTKIILFHRVWRTALGIAHILLFFICGIGAVFMILFGQDRPFRTVT